MSERILSGLDFPHPFRNLYTYNVFSKETRMDEENALLNSVFDLELKGDWSNNKHWTTCMDAYNVDQGCRCMASCGYAKICREVAVMDNGRGL